MWLGTLIIVTVLSLVVIADGQPMTFAPSVVIRSTPEPTLLPTLEPTPLPTQEPTALPTPMPTVVQTDVPSLRPSQVPPDLSRAPDIVDTAEPDVIDTAEPDYEIIPQNETNSPPLPSEKVMNVVDGAATVAALTASGSAGQIALIADTHCGESSSLPIALHPLQVVGMKTMSDSVYLAAVVGNSIILISFTLISVVLTFVVHIYRTYLSSDTHQKKTSYADSNLYYRSLLRFPSSSCIVFLCLFQGTSLSALKLVLGFDSVGKVITGIIATVACIAIPIALVITIRNGVLHGKGVFHIMKCESPKSMKTKIEHFIIGPGEWISTEWGWIQRYTTMVRAYNSNYCWFIMSEFISSGLLSIANSPSNKEHSTVICGHTRLFSGLICLLLAGIQVRLAPHTRYRDQVLNPVRVFLQGIALLFLAIGFYTESDGCFTAGSAFLTAAISVLMLKLALDLSTEIYVLLTKRRGRHQEDFWSMIGSNCNDPTTEVLLRKDSSGTSVPSCLDDEDFEMKILVHPGTKRHLLRPAPMNIDNISNTGSDHSPVVLFDASDVETVEDSSSSDTPRSVCSYSPPAIPTPVRSPFLSDNLGPTPRRPRGSIGFAPRSPAGSRSNSPYLAPLGGGSPSPLTPPRPRSRQGSRSPSYLPVSPGGSPANRRHSRRPLTPAGRGCRSPIVRSERRRSLPVVESFCGFSVPAGRGRQQAKQNQSLAPPRSSFEAFVS